MENNLSHFSKRRCNLQNKIDDKQNTSITSISASSEDYLEAIYLLSIKEKQVHSVDIANHLQVAKASVSKAMGVLRAGGFIQQEKYGTVTLTPEGEKRAIRVHQYHDVLVDFFVKVLHVDPDEAAQEACKIEHVVSPGTMRKLIDYVSSNS
jgi:Mn-dependent DtxR family transcriptional regulator